MSKTWRGVPVGHPRDPRPPEKGGHKNLYKEAVEEEFTDFDDDLLMEIDDSPDWEELAELERETN
jgi:hypothetical protein